MNESQWQTVLASVLSPTVIVALLVAFQNWQKRRDARPRETATTSATMLDAQGRENQRLSTRNDQLDTRIAELERKQDESEARERLLIDALHRFTVWAAQVTEVAHRSNIELPPAPQSPITSP